MNIVIWVVEGKIGRESILLATTRRIHAATKTDCDIRAGRLRDVGQQLRIGNIGVADNRIDVSYGFIESNARIKTFLRGTVRGVAAENIYCGWTCQRAAKSIVAGERV